MTATRFACRLRGMTGARRWYDPEIWMMSTGGRRLELRAR
jgi:hypothetical protein